MTVLPNSTVRSFLSDPEAARKVYAKLLRRAFPETSDAAIAKRAAPVLGEDEKTIRRHLRLNHSVKVEHFLAVAAMAMRQVLVTHARARHAVKRGGAAQREHLTIADPVDPRTPADLDILALEEVLAQLEREDPPLARIVELRYFAGMSIEQIALVMGLSERTVNRQWRLARAELATRLGGPEHAP